MSIGQGFIVQAFTLPSGQASAACDLRPSSRLAMRQLLRSAAQHESPKGRLSEICTWMARLAIEQADQLIIDPLLFSALHAHSKSNCVLRDWHETVATSSMPDVLGDVETDITRSSAIGNVLTSLRLRVTPDWCGRELLLSDDMGRLRFVGSDWSVALFDESERDDVVLARQIVEITMTPEGATLSLLEPNEPFLHLSRAAIVCIATNGSTVCAKDVVNLSDSIKTSIRSAVPVAERGGRIRFDPVSFVDYEQHAADVGGIVAEVLSAISRFSPMQFVEFGKYIDTVRGHEFLRSRRGVVGSFSDPTLPGIMNFNVSFTENHEPCLSPFCFTWFGHELGHSKNYLIDSIAFSNGYAFVRNPSDMTNELARYGRALSVRTILQVPYVHLHEWCMLMDFLDAGLDQLPWDTSGDVHEIGEEMQAEILESLDVITDVARLTKQGHDLITHIRELLQLTRDRWTQRSTSDKPTVSRGANTQEKPA